MADGRSGPIWEFQECRQNCAEWRSGLIVRTTEPRRDGTGGRATQGSPVLPIYRPAGTFASAARLSSAISSFFI
jgi:hypothetical protein